MKSPAFDRKALKSFVEGKIGRTTLFEMVTACSRPDNFRVVTGTGEKFLVKCVSSKKTVAAGFLERFLPHLQDLAQCPEAIHLAHGPWAFGDFTVVALAWCAGGRVMPDRTSPAQRDELIRAYGVFSEAIQNVRAVLPPRDCVAERAQALAILERLGCRSLHRLIRDKIPESTLVYDPGRLKVIHGDFHHGNFHFDGDRVSGFLDFEEFRRGYATEDWMRYLICGAEHLRWFDFAGRRRILDFLSRLLPLAPADEWRFAVDAFLVRKIYRRFSKKRTSLMKIWWAQKIRFRFGFYRAIRSRIAAYGNGRDVP